MFFHSFIIQIKHNEKYYKRCLKQIFDKNNYFLKCFLVKNLIFQLQKGKKDALIFFLQIGVTI